MITSRVRPRVLALLTGVALLGALLIAATSQAQAPPPSSLGTPAYEPIAMNTWEVVGLNATSTIPFQVQVWDLEEINGVMYVGGRFTGVRQGPGSPTIGQAFLAAFDSATGEWLPGFRPTLDNGVYALSASPDGNRLLVGGEFSNVNGAPDTAGLAALDLASGAVDLTWVANITHRWGGNVSVKSLEVVDDDVMIGGSFTHVNGADGVEKRAWRLARLDGATGALDTNFAGKVSGARVYAMAISADQQWVHVGGYFEVVNGQSVEWFATLDAETGDFAPVPQGMPANIPRNGTSATNPFAMVATADHLYVATEWHLLQVYDAKTLELEYLYWAGGQGGDYQALALDGGLLWAGGHNHGFQQPTDPPAAPISYTDFVDDIWSRVDDHTAVNWASAHDAATGRHLAGFVPKLEMTEGVWAIEVADNGNVWVGGDARRSGPQSVGGFAVFRPTQAGDPVNLARAAGATAGASSRFDWGSAVKPRTGVAAKAFDGHTGPNEQENTAARTQTENNPWVGVDLGTVRGVDTIRVWPMHYVGNFKNWERIPVPPLLVAASESPIGEDPATAIADPAVSTWALGADPVPYEDVTVGANARYVKVFATGNHQLSLSELEVFGGEAINDPGPAPVALVGPDAFWRYLDTGEAPAANWTARSFDHRSWAFGTGQFGFGDGDETTVVASNNVTYWFRTYFNADDPGAFDAVELSLIQDDGSVVYLNGVEISRINLPVDAGPNTRATAAVWGSAERTPTVVAIDPALLVPGLNTLAVEVHNEARRGRDLSFAATVTARR